MHFCCVVCITWCHNHDVILVSMALMLDQSFKVVMWQSCSWQYCIISYVLNNSLSKYIIAFINHSFRLLLLCKYHIFHSWYVTQRYVIWNRYISTCNGLSLNWTDQWGACSHDTVYSRHCVANCVETAAVVHVFRTVVGTRQLLLFSLQCLL